MAQMGLGAGVSRRGVLAGVLAAPLLARRAHAEAQYFIDPRFGSVEFTVSHLGLFSSHGSFRRFDARLDIDPAQPEHTSVVADIDATSVSMAWQDAEEMLRSAEFFDVAQYPKVHFRSTAVRRDTLQHYTVAGLVEMRGVTQPITLDATLLGRDPQQASVAGQADFKVSGTLRRSAFGMVAEQNFISDQVRLTIAARVQLVGADRAG